MHKPAEIAGVIDIFLQPGEVYFGERNIRIRTLLGSCVAVTLWHPDLLIGGMCHYMLPKQRREKSKELDGRYADEAVQLLLKEIQRAGTLPHEYQVKLFGGGHMFSAQKVARDDHVGAQNVDTARTLMKQHGFALSAEHLGGSGHRNIFFEIWNGHVWVKHQPPQTNNNKALKRGAVSKSLPLADIAGAITGFNQ